MGNSEKGLNAVINFQLNIGQFLQYRVCVCSAVFARSENKHTVIEIPKFSTQLTKFTRRKWFCFNVSFITMQCLLRGHLNEVGVIIWCPRKIVCPRKLVVYAKLRNI